MKFGNFFYQVEFEDGRVLRRECVTKSLAKAAYETFVYEMVALQVQAVTWGEMKA